MTRTCWPPIVYAIAGCILATPAVAQRATLSGQVLDLGDRQPITAAVVELRPARTKVLTDAQGRFTLTTSPGEHVLVVGAMGYAATLTPLTVEAPGGEVVVRLAKDPIMMAGIVATVDRLQTRRRASPYPVRALDAAQIASSGASNISELVQSRMGVHFVPCRFRSRRAQLLSMVGQYECVASRGGTTPMTVFIDGVRMPGPDFLTMYTPQEVAVVEVYRNGASVQIFTRAFIERMGSTNALPPAP
jgi:hypothetical protein